MTVNLAKNVRQALANQFHEVNVHCWLDSSFALCWIADKGDYRKFVANKVLKIRQHEVSYSTCRLQKTRRTSGVVEGRSPTMSFGRMVHHGLATLASGESNEFSSQRRRFDRKQRLSRSPSRLRSRNNSLLTKYSLPKVLRIRAWERRFIRNSQRKPSERVVGPIDSSEVLEQRKWWVRRAQEAAKEDPRFQLIKKRSIFKRINSTS